MEPDVEDEDFLLSHAAIKVNKAAEAFLLLDPRFLRPSQQLKRELFLRLGLRLDGPWSLGAFDLVFAPSPLADERDAVSRLDELILIEVKGTRKRRDAALNGFFFGATATEFALAAAVRDRFRYAFVVLHDANEYGQPFAVLLTTAQVEERIRTSRLQYQINFRTKMDRAQFSDDGVVFVYQPGNTQGVSSMPDRRGHV